MGLVSKVWHKNIGQSLQIAALRYIYLYIYIQTYIFVSKQLLSI